MDDLLPGGPASFKQTRVDSTSMLLLIGTQDLDLDCAGVCAPGHIQPGPARDRHWIYRVGDDEMTKSKIVFGHSVARSIASVIKGHDGHA
jgi:hypothetical protein